MAKQRKKREKSGNRKRRRTAALLPRVLLLILLASALAWRLHTLRVQVDDARAERDRIRTELADLRRENEALEADIAEGATQDKMEDLARDQLGLVKPDEYVFITGN